MFFGVETSKPEQEEARPNHFILLMFFFVFNVEKIKKPPTLDMIRNKKIFEGKEKDLKK